MVRNPSTIKQRMLQMALRLFAQKGYFQTTVDEVVDAAGASKGSFYFHFPNKEAVFLALVEQITVMLFQGIEQELASEQQAAVKIRNTLASALDIFGRHRDLARLVLVEAEVAHPQIREKQAAIHSRFIELIAQQLDHLIARGYIAPLDTRIAATAFFGSINAAVSQWLRQDPAEPLSNWVDELAAYNLRAIGLPPVKGGDI